jgi:hypothetical protein
VPSAVYRRPPRIRRRKTVRRRHLRRRAWLGTAAAAFDATIEVDWTGNPTAGYFDQLRYSDGLVSYWRLNSGSTLVDELGANNGSMNGTPPTAAGALPNDTDLAVAFDGSTDDGVIDSAATVANPFSLEGWVRVPALPASTRDIVAKRGSYLLQVDSAGRLLFLIKNDTTVTSVQSGAGMTTNTWYHVVCTYDGATASIYINGVLDQAASHTVGVGLGLQPLRFAATPSTASPTYQSTTTAQDAVGSAPVTGNLPASTASGDLEFAHIVFRSATATVTPPAGWTLLSSVIGFNDQQLIYYKIAGGAEPASYTWTFSAAARWVIAISRFTGVDATYPIADSYVVKTASGTSHSPGSHLSSVDNNMAIALFAGAGVTWTESSGTEQYDQQTGGGGTHVSQAMSTQTQASASALAVTGTASVATDGYAAFIVLCGSGLNRIAVTPDEFSLWNVALTADDVVQHYQARLGGVGTWTDISADVDNFATRSGRVYELDRIGPGQSTTVVDDLERDYDPANSSGPYAPNVIPLRKIRHRINLSGTYYPIARGFIASYPAEYQGDSEMMTLTATDGFEQLTQARVTGTLHAGRAGEQIHRLLDLAGWPRADRAIDTGQFVMAETLLSSSAKALSEIQAIAESELGSFFIDAAGIATFHDFSHRWSASRSIATQATFSNADGDPWPSYSGLRPFLDRDRIVNDWTISTAAGINVSVSDALSMSKFFRRSQTRSTRLDDPNDAAEVGNALLRETAYPALRYDQLTVELVNPTHSAAVLPLTISDRITVIHAPSQAAGGPTTSKDLFIEGTSWAVRMGELWSVTLQLSPCSPSTYHDMLLLLDPVSYWRFNATT